jgi:hypothetical protein
MCVRRVLVTRWFRRIRQARSWRFVS